MFRKKFERVAPSFFAFFAKKGGDFDLPCARFYFGGLVIAPCEADETSAAYLAKTPVG
jgi:hypothetical protein